MNTDYGLAGQRCCRVFLRACTLLLAAVPLPGVVTAADHAEQDEAAAAFFGQGAVARLEVRLTDEAAESLRRDPRAWTTCTLVENGATSHDEVAVKIKGGYGSTRDLDDRPALTLNMDKHVRGRRFHGLDKFHLNNSVQDDSLLREYLGSAIVRAASIPAPRVSHARVWIDGRDVGLYVLKESFDKDFLRRSFPQPDGNLYDGGLLQDIDSGLERDEGDRGEPGADLAELVTACLTLDEATRWQAIEARLDVEGFLTFAAVEAMTGHWDGYCSMRNNYRVYMDPDAGGRARFLPHGMDQILGDAEARIDEPPAALVAMAVFENPAWRRRYRERVRELLPLFTAEENLLPKLDAAVERLRPIVLDMGPEPLERFNTAVDDLRNVLVAREANLREQADAPEPLVWPMRLQAAMRTLNAADTSTEELSIPDSEATDFLRANVPWFECPDPEFEHDYYRRWWTLRRYIRHTDAGVVIENLPPAFGDPLKEVRWLRDLQISGLDAISSPAAAADGPRSCDAVITEIIGLKLHPDTTVEVDPAPPHDWTWFAMDRIAYQGRLLTVVWDESGEHYGRGSGLRVLVDGREVARADSLRRLVSRLP
jgi:spore coat protein H